MKFGYPQGCTPWGRGDRGPLGDREFRPEIYSTKFLPVETGENRIKKMALGLRIRRAASMDCERSIIDVLQGLMTPAIGAVALWIAYQQRRISADQKEIAFQQKELNRIKLNADLYDRRLKVYSTLQSFLTEGVKHAQISWEQAIQFYRDTREGDHLFGDEVGAYIEVVFQKGIEFGRAVDGYKQGIAPNSDTDPAPHGEVMNEMLIWFDRQLRDSKKVFKPYLQLK